MPRTDDSFNPLNPKPGSTKGAGKAGPSRPAVKKSPPAKVGVNQGLGGGTSPPVKPLPAAKRRPH